MSKSNKGDGNEGGGRTIVTMAAVTATTTMWVMAMATRLAGNKEGKGKGSKGKCDGNEGGGHKRGQEWQGDCDGNKGGGQAYGNVDNEGDGYEDEGGR